MKKFLLFTGLLILAHSTFAQSNNAQFQPFIPKGFNLTETDCKGDFNKDGKNDCILIIQNTQKSAWQKNINDRLVNRNRRGIIVLFKTLKSYEKVLENKAIFGSENEEGGVYFAPDLVVESSKNKLIINYLHGRYGYWSYTFDYRDINFKKDFYLIGYDSSHNHGPYTESMDSVNFLTRKYCYQKNVNTNFEDNTPKFKTTCYALPKKSLLKLSDIQDMDEVDKQLNHQLEKITSPNDES